MRRRERIHKLPMLRRRHIPQLERRACAPEILAIIMPQRNGGARPIHATSSISPFIGPNKSGSALLFAALNLNQRISARPEGRYGYR